jgi:hypothetical protein
MPRGSDKPLRHPKDEPAIGLLPCGGENWEEVEYALQGLKQPVGAADGETQLVRDLPHAGTPRGRLTRERALGGGTGVLHGLGSRVQGASPAGVGRAPPKVPQRDLSE